MADNKVVLEFEIKGNGEQKAQSVRAQMKALRDELLRLDEGTAEFEKVQRKLGDLTDKVGDLSKGVNTLAGDPLERLNNSFSMIGSSILSLDFGAAQQGLQGVSSAVKDFKFGDLTTAAKGFGSTMLDLGKSLLLNPIFLLGGIIAGIVMNFDKLVNAGGLVGKMFGFIKDTIDSVTGGLVDFLDYIGLTDSKASERAENQKKLDKENEDRRKKQEQEALKDAEHLHQEKERLAKEAAAKEAARIQKIKDDQKSLTDFLLGEEEKRYQKLLTNRERELRQLELEYEAKKKLAHGNKEILVQLDNELFAQRLGIESNYFTASKQIKAAGVAEETKIKSDGLRSSIQFATDEELLQYDTQQNITRISAEEQQKRIDMAFAVAGSLMSIMDSLGKNDKASAKRRFNINKALGIAQAGINTYMAVNAALTAGGNPIKLATGAQFVEAGIALTMGLASVAKISATKFNDGGGSSTPSGGGGGMGAIGGSGGGGSTSAPALDLSFLNNGQTKAQPIQSYVLATNVTSAQDAQQKILDQSKLIK
jgi:hypothetical protein